MGNDAKSVRWSLWTKLQDDISELTKWLQKLLKQWLDKWYITEDEIISEIDDIDKQIEQLEKLYELTGKLNIKIETIEDVLEKEMEEMKKITSLWKITMYENNYTVNDKQYNDLIKLYFNDISKIPLLTWDEEKSLAYRIREWDWMAKKILIASNLRLVISIAKKFLGSRLSFMDLVQEWNIWLIKAIDKFMPEKDFKFSTYATWWIKQSITKSIADMTKNVRIPVHLIDEINSYNKTSQMLFQQLWREATSKEISAKLWFSIKKIKKLEEVIYWNISLDVEVWDEWKDSLWDLIADTNTLRPDQVIQRKVVKDNLDSILEMLDEREAKIVKMRYWIDWPKYTLEQVWEEFNVTRERVRQIEQKVLQKLQEHEWLQKLLWLEDEWDKYKFFEDNRFTKLNRKMHRDKRRKQEEENNI